jgi:hypothetical protein
MKHREETADRGEQEHEECGGDNAEGAEGDDGEITKANFDDEEVDGPDGHEQRDGEGDGGAGGSAPVDGVYAHGDEDGNGSIVTIICER